MNFNNHMKLKDKHAMLGASSYHWINYSQDKMIEFFRKSQAKALGTKLHDLASKCIKLKQRLPDEPRTLNMFVNDALSFKMASEQVLYYSDNCFGTTDAISFRKEKLRIHDLKTGTTPAHFEQLIIYAALFCLEYRIKPGDIQIELRIYQNNEVIIKHITAVDVLPVMDKIRKFDKLINRLKDEEGID